VSTSSSLGAFPSATTVGSANAFGWTTWINSRIGNNVVISQGALIIQGSHDYKTDRLPDLQQTRGAGRWIMDRGRCDRDTLGVTVRSHAVLAVGSVATKDLEAYTIYQGNPALPVRERVVL
jgi:putative colanic acid biosynthesis acetyltransferase WcaF